MLQLHNNPLAVSGPRPGCRITYIGIATYHARFRPGVTVQTEHAKLPETWALEPYIRHLLSVGTEDGVGCSATRVALVVGDHPDLAGRDVPESQFLRPGIAERNETLVG